MRRLALASMAVALGPAFAGCGDADDEPAAAQTSTAASGAIELTVVYDDGSGRKTTGGLTCRGADQTAEGVLRDARSAGELCRQARGISAFLTAKPDAGRACTQIYGGPETAVVTGTIDGDKVERRFSRTNGCELADYKRAAGLLQQ
ncbi:MAG TPA: hypothetical protein VNA28_10625 [Solirubrobacteraceae bacterium]|nr:hypothetical protein [Solirubrobacteraceae bacterium]